MIYEITICTTRNLTSKISQAGHKRYVVEIWGLVVHFSDQMQEQTWPNNNMAIFILE